MKIKAEIMLGLGLLSCLIILLAGVGFWHINDLRRATNNILAANYNSLEYSRNMLLAIDELNTNPNAIKEFEKNLLKENNNNTEAGEGEATQKIANHFSELKNNPTHNSLKVIIRKELTTVMELNMKAISQKSGIANDTAANAIAWIIITWLLCLLIAFGLLFKLPKIIVSPILQLTDSIRQIANHNYDKRLKIKGKNEFTELAKSFNVMAERLEGYSNSKLNRILKEKERIETLINNMHDPVIGLDENKVVIFINDEALTIIGLTRDKILGKSVLDIAVANDLIRTLIIDIVNPQTDKDNVPLKIFYNGKESYFDEEVINIDINRAEANTKELIGYVILLKDITIFKELDYAKTNFIATISRELKTPINSINVITQMLKNNETGVLNDEQTRLMGCIEEEGAQLLQITRELANMSQVDTGNIQLKVQLTDPRVIVSYAISTIRLQAEQKGITLSENIEPEVPDVVADTEKTAWILINFLTNAIRYSINGGEVIVSLKKEKTYVVFSVRDFGKGIDDRYKDKVFERYFQVPGISKSGAGLGLAISKEFIEAQSGTIGMSSNIGMGSTFYFTLPYHVK